MKHLKSFNESVDKISDDMYTIELWRYLEECVDDNIIVNIGGVIDVLPSEYSIKIKEISVKGMKVSSDQSILSIKLKESDLTFIDIRYGLDEYNRIQYDTVDGDPEYSIYIYVNGKWLYTTQHLADRRFLLRDKESPFFTTHVVNNNIVSKWIMNVIYSIESFIGQRDLYITRCQKIVEDRIKSFNESSNNIVPDYKYTQDLYRFVDEYLTDELVLDRYGNFISLNKVWVDLDYMKRSFMDKIINRNRRFLLISIWQDDNNYAEIIYKLDGKNRVIHNWCHINLKFGDEKVEGNRLRSDVKNMSNDGEWSEAFAKVVLSEELIEEEKKIYDFLNSKGLTDDVNRLPSGNIPAGVY